MTEIHQVKCDKCGKVGNMRAGGMYIGYVLPQTWVNIEQGWFLNKDLCSACFRKFKKHSGGFWK